MSEADLSAPANRRLDQWLWFARFAKSRTTAARLCAAGQISVNGIAVKKANHVIRVGDTVIFAQRGYRRTVRVLALGLRRGTATEAQTLYQEAAAALRVADEAPEWVPLLGDEPEG